MAQKAQPAADKRTSDFPASPPAIDLVVRRAIAIDGPIVLWRGLGPTLLRDVPFSAMYWVGYEKLRESFGRRLYGTHFVGKSGRRGGLLLCPPLWRTGKS
jgi:solute carrier family 25 protein 39/40